MNPLAKSYLDLPGNVHNKNIDTKDRKISLKESTKVFEHFMEPGEKPDLQDILTNPKYGNEKRTNVIYEHSTGKPEDSITESPVIHPVTEEWVDDRNQEPKLKPQNVDYRLVMSNSDLQNLPAIFNKDFSTPDAEIHLTVDKTALEGKKSILVSKDDSKDRKLYVDSQPLIDEMKDDDVLANFEDEINENEMYRKPILI